MLGKLLSFLRGEGEASGPLALYHAGAREEAERLAGERLANDPADRAGLLTQALLLLDRGRGKDAMNIAERLLAANAKDAQALLVMGRAQAAAGRRKPALDSLQAAARLRGGDAAIQAELAMLAVADGRIDEAAQHLASLRASGPRFAQAHAALGLALLQRGALEAGAEQLRRALAADDNDASVHANLGAVLKDLGRGEEAIAALERALELQPQLPQAAYNLAMLRLDSRDWSAAAQLLRTYLASNARDAEAHYWLGNACMGLGDAAAARAAYGAAVRCDGQHARARWGLAMAQLPAIAATREEQQQALDAFGQELTRLQDWVQKQAKGEPWLAVGAQQPFFLAYLSGNHAPLLRRYGALCAELMALWARKNRLPAPAKAAPGGRIRVGIVSAHIHGHSVWHAILRGWLQHLDPQRFELHLFHTGHVRDAETEAAARAARLHHGLGDWAGWVRAVSEVQPDVLVYPEIGMDSTTVRLASLRLARVQLAGWGHPLTSGLPTIDGYVSAQALEPAGAQAHYSEQLHALPRLGCAYQPYGTRPQPPELSAWNIAPDDRLLLAPGTAFKYAPQDDVLWVEVARRCAPCKLVFFRGEGAHAARLEQRLRAAFAAAGVDFEASVRFVPWQTQAGFFGLLQRADVFLDTVGFSGFNTAMQALECGTPIVAWEGDFLRGRLASAVLRSLALDEWVARSHEDYAARVARLCGDAGLRQQVREQIAARRASLYDDRASVQAFAELLQRLAA